MQKGWRRQREGSTSNRINMRANTETALKTLPVSISIEIKNSIDEKIGFLDMRGYATFAWQL